ADHMWQIHGAKMHRTTVTRWNAEYSYLVKNYTDRLEPEIKGNTHSDEVIVKVCGHKEHRWGVIDTKTKYKISGRLTKKRTYKDGAKPLYYKLKHKCKGIPPKIISDKLGHYRKAFNKYFYRTTAKMVHGVPIACKKYGLEHNNNPAERDNARVKQRTKTMRGFGAHKTAEAFLDMLDIHHNYIKPSMSLDGRYPAEEAGIYLNLGRNRLLSLIHLASFG
ncbi:MAG: DDE-type integrase/transposase/recombinase, partial [Thermoplasmata archaeon]